MTSLDSFGPSGLLLPALALAALLVLDVGALAFPKSSARYRVVGGLTLVLSGFVLVLQLLFYVNWLWPRTLFAVLIASVVTARVLVARRRKAEKEARTEALSGALGASGRGPFLPGFVFFLPTASVALAALGLATLAAFWLPIWQWDSLGYHLPFVNFVLQGGGRAELPYDVPYLSTYPRNVELLFVALRATLPDDRLVDVAQIPFGLICVAATAAIARELGATRVHALIASSLFLTLPAVFLQLPTDYIDVATASFFLLAAFFLVTTPTTTTLVCAGLAIGLFLGTKPSAPPTALLLAVVLFCRARGAKLTRLGLVAIALSGLLGLEAYVTETIRHGNPVWPATVHIGPIELPGTISVKELLSSGAGAQKVHGSMPSRIWQSWTNLNAMPLFDMRVGGLGWIFFLSIPGAVLGLVRRKSWVFVALVALSVVTPDPAVVRYVFPLPALLLALSAAEVSTASATWLARLDAPGRHVLAFLAALGVAGLGIHNLVYAAPGLIGEGPPLFDYARMDWPTRERAVGANGPPTEFVDARERLAHDEVAVYDRALWLPYLMWRSDLSNRVVRIPDGSSHAEIERLLSAPRVRLIAAGKDQSIYPLVIARPERFHLLFDCREPCAVYTQP